MIGLLCEAALLMIIVSAMTEGERDYSKFVFFVIIVGIINLGIFLLLWESIGYFIYIPMAIVYLLTLGNVFGLTFKKALIALVILMGFRYLFSLLLAI